MPGLLAKDGFEGVQLVGLPDGRALAVKIADGARPRPAPGDPPRPGTVGLDAGALAALQPDPVLGGGRPVGELRAVDFTR